MTDTGIGPSAIDLAGTWTLKSLDESILSPLPLPGDALSALRDAGRIPDPYVGENELQVRWVAEKDWRALRSFSLTEAEAALPWTFAVDALDTVADVFINGAKVLSADTMFRAHRAPAGTLKAGENTVEILFRSNVVEAARRNGEQPFPVPYVTQNLPIPYGNLIRKVQCHGGWDWNLAVMPFGVYGAIGLERADLPSIAYLQHRQAFAADGSVTVTFEIRIEAPAAAEETVSLRLGSVSTSQAVRLVPGTNVVSLAVSVDKPDLWWPAGSGAQTLYDVEARVGSIVRRQRIGLRALEVNTRRDAIGVPLTVRINGRDIFCRGANWIPGDALPSAITPENVRPLLEDAVAVGMNMLRVWGGGQYETDWFYDLCDELGILIWQDMMFSCSLYPADDAFLTEVDREIEHQVRRIAHHASLALWCGDNEVIGALTWFEESRKNRDRYLVAYDRLNRTIDTAVRRADPDRLFWPSSPSKGPLDFGDGWKAEGSGDMHMWDVWHAGKSFDAYRDVRPRFASEFGFQSFTSLPTMSRYIAEEDFDISSPAMELHQKNAGGNARIVETISRYFRFPKNFENVVYLSQVQQGLAMRTGIDFWRSIKPECMGTLYWQLNDTYPVASWSSIEYGGRWKLMHNMARHFFAPVNVIAIPSKDGATVEILAVNDTPDTVAISGSVAWMGLDGWMDPIGSLDADIPTDRAVSLRVFPTGTLRDRVLVWTWTDAAGTHTEHLSIAPYKALKLNDPALKVEASKTAPGVWTFTLSAEAPAFYTALETRPYGVFSDNAVLVLPGKPVTITWTSRTGDVDPLDSLVVRDLWSSYRPSKIVVSRTGA
ncbi:beta-mannosidase [Oryzibacter oryziterrae]|uniref:beta-mannosidase n=1 Tax=Oryzibacter oryziterrae TaxID=2766474 RepID=UPI001F221335|nr:glycoside hydrolase family 2 protein [Oryzibacter oryziterrae]